VLARDVPPGKPNVGTQQLPALAPHCGGRWTFRRAKVEDKGRCWKKHEWESAFPLFRQVVGWFHALIT